MKTRQLITPALLLGILTACATPRVRFDKPGISDAERKRDERECVAASMMVGGAWRPFGVYNVDRDAYESCLKSRGYQEVTSAPPGA